MIVIACGSRHWTDAELLRRELDDIRSANRDLLIVEGRARGADRMAGAWAQETPGVEWQPFPADWQDHDHEWCFCAPHAPYCRGAGYRRNQTMLEFALVGADERMVVAFKDDFDHTLKSGGTEDMVRRCREHGLNDLVISHGG